MALNITRMHFGRKVSLRNQGAHATRHRRRHSCPAAWQLPRASWLQPSSLRRDDPAPAEQANDTHRMAPSKEGRAELPGKAGDTKVPAASPAQINANFDYGFDYEALCARARASIARTYPAIERSKALRASFKEDRRRREQAQLAAAGKTPHTQPVLRPHGTTAAAPWPPTAGSAAPTCRTAAAEASAAAALVWAASAMKIEAKAEASAARIASDPAAKLTFVALEWQEAAAAWRAAFEQLEYARQADPQASAVQQAEQSIRDMRSFKRQCQQWGEAA
ncbi:hypothetical protein ACK3TF_004183 [Chlorella vulgaris]